MPSIADIHTGAPENVATIYKLPSEKIIDTYMVGIGAAYSWTGLSMNRSSTAKQAPTIHEDDGTLQVTERRSHFGEIQTGFHASDPERLQVVEGLVVVNDLGRITTALFQTSSDGGETYEDFLFSRRAWTNLANLIAEHSDSFRRKTVLDLIPSPEN